MSVAEQERPARRRDAWKVWGPSLLLIVIGFVITWPFVDPPPPDHLVIATGGATGAYFRYGQRYKELLAERGIEVELRETAGSLANLALLRSGEVDLALVQGGTATADDAEELRSLGSLYHEPLWVFCRKGSEPKLIVDVRGRRCALGAEGSGTRALATRVLLAAGVTADAIRISDLGGAEAAAALRAGDVDVVFYVASASAAYVSDLMRDPAIALAPATRNRALERRLPELAAVTLFAGMVDLERDLPSVDVPMVAATANLVARDDVHHALVPLLLEIATEVHESGGAFEERGRFPSPQTPALPLEDTAANWYRKGPSFLYRVLPFRVASFVDRLKILLVPLLTLLIPLLKVTPPVYRWRIRKRIYRWYASLRGIETEGSAEDADANDLLGRLDALEAEIREVKVPLSYMQELYHLRLHVDLVRNEIVG